MTSRINISVDEFKKVKVSKFDDVDKTTSTESEKSMASKAMVMLDKLDVNSIMDDEDNLNQFNPSFDLGASIDFDDDGDGRSIITIEDFGASNAIGAELSVSLTVAYSLKNAIEEEYGAYESDYDESDFDEEYIEY